MKEPELREKISKLLSKIIIETIRYADVTRVIDVPIYVEEILTLTKEALPELAEISFKAGQLAQSALDQVNFDKERVKFWSEIAESYKAGEKSVVETYQRENPNSYKEYEAWWRIFRKLEGIE